MSNRGPHSDVSPSDYELVQRMAERDPAAFTTFYDRHHGRILGFLCQMLPSRGDAEDVSQEAFWQAWTQSGRYDARRGRPTTWLLTMARSRALDQLRRRAVRETPQQNATPETLPAVDEVLERLETRRVAQRALNRLPQEQRLVVTLAFFQGHTHQEIADLTAAPLGTVKSRIRLGMQRLRELVEQESAA